MGKIVSVTGNVDVLPLIAAALKSKQNGCALGDRCLMDTKGDFNVSALLSVNLTGNIGEDYTSTSYEGVSIDLVIDMILEFCGATEDHARKACEVAAEITRAKAENRDIRPISYTTTNGETVQLTYEEMQAAVAKVKERKERIQKLAKDDRFSKIIKVQGKRSGPINFNNINFKVATLDVDQSQRNVG